MKGNMMKIVGIVLLVLGIVYALAFVPVIFLGHSMPTAGLIAPVVCGGSGYELVTDTELVHTSATRARILTSMQCVSTETGELKDAPLLLILAVVPGVLMAVIGLAVYNAAGVFASAGGMSGMREMQAIARVPEVKVKLDALIEDLKVGRISQEEYTEKMYSIINEYKARQAAA
jgi:hypothetical protein